MLRSCLIDKIYYLCGSFFQKDYPAIMSENTNGSCFFSAFPLGEIKRVIFCLFFSFLFISCHGGTKKEIYASEILKLIDKGEPVQFYDRIILDDLDFSEAKDAHISSISSIQKPIRSNIFFVNCVFMGKVMATGLYQEKMQKVVLFEKNVTFFNCDFRGEVNFDNVIFNGEIDFSRSVFRDKASFNEITAFGKKNLFTDIVSESSFNMINVLIHGNINFMNAKFQSNASFQSMTVNDLQFSNAVFEKKVDFSNTVVYKNSFFNYVVYNGNLIFSFSKFYGDADFLNSSFEQGADFSGSFYYGRTRFNDSVFKGDVIFSKSVFIQMPQMENTTLREAIEVQVIENKKVLFD
jgi:uncharacterized protein YjbI with pentapeptide repeats